MLMYVIFEELSVITFVDFFPELFYLLLRVNAVNHDKTSGDVILITILLLLITLILVEYESLLIELLIYRLD